MSSERQVVDRRFEGFVFDWDGTAVPNRGADASELRGLVERLCADGAYVAVVSGTHLENVDGQLRARPEPPGRLVLALNRGSEVFAVDGSGPRLVYRRAPTMAEDAALDDAAALTVRRLTERGLAVEIVSQRLNRRKIDLIPVSEWSDPPKARIGELLGAVEQRLFDAGFGGLPEVVEIAIGAGARRGPRGYAGDERRQARGDRAHRQGRLGRVDLRRPLEAWCGSGIGPCRGGRVRQPRRAPGE